MSIIARLIQFLRVDRVPSPPSQSHTFRRYSKESFLYVSGNGKKAEIVATELPAGSGTYVVQTSVLRSWLEPQAEMTPEERAELVEQFRLWSGAKSILLD